LDCVIIGHETLCNEYDPEAKRQSLEWRSKNSPKPKKPWMSNSKVKTVFFFFDISGIIHFEFIPEGSTVKPWMSNSKVKTMFFFFDISSMIDFEFIPEGSTVNRTSYAEVLKGLLLP
jgi:hypothetical protein